MSNDSVSKYLIFHMVSHTIDYYQDTPEEEAESQKKVNAFFDSWYPKVRQVTAAHCMNMGAEWDWIGVFTTDELSYWEAMREEYKRLFGKRTKSNFTYLGVSHAEFTEATNEVDHYKKLRALGMMPGMVEDYTGTE